MSSRALRSATAPAMDRPAAETVRTPTTEEIAIRAYEIYQSRGATDGGDIGDWLQAEQELTEVTE
jgi:hypothetical protein